MSTSDLPVFKLAHVSDERKKFLLRWRLERKLDLALRKQKVAEGCQTKNPGSVKENAISIRPFDKFVCLGDIRLLRRSDVQDHGRLLYVLVLYVRNDNFTSVVVPFSTYSVPCCKDEWLTGLAGEPLKVLQFWNAQPVPTYCLAQSWKVEKLDRDRLEAAKTLYAHAISGTWPQGELRKKIGLAILNPHDERLAYQHEELVHFEVLRSRLFRLQQDALQQARRKFTDQMMKQRAPFQERFAASSGDVFAVVHIYQEGRIISTLRAKRDIPGGKHTFSWRLEKNNEILLPGLPACLYGSAAKKALRIQGQTESDGNVITFKAPTLAVFRQIVKAENIIISVEVPKKEN